MSNNQTPKLRTCKDCGGVFPHSAEFFYKKGATKTAPKFDTRCKSCANKQRHAWRMANPEVHERDKAAQRRSHEKHREKRNAATRQHRLDNLEYYREFDRQRYYNGKKEYNREQRHKNRERYMALQRANYRRHAERYRAYKRAKYAENPELYRERRRQQWQNNHVYRLKCKISGRRKEIKRAQRERELPETLTSIQWQRALEYFNGCCAVCGRQLRDLFATHTVALDHWIPINNPDCPGTTALNSIPLCHGKDGCNNSKHDKLPAEWLTWKFSPSQAAKILARIEAYFAWVREQDDHSETS